MTRVPVACAGHENSSSNAETLGRERFRYLVERPQPFMTRIFRGYEPSIYGDSRVYTWEKRPVVFSCGEAWVYAEGEGRRRRYVVVDACGLSGTPGGLRRLRDARALCRTLGSIKAERYWERASRGDARAASALARLHRIYNNR